MDSFLITLYTILGIYYISGCVAFIRIYIKNKNKNRIVLNAIIFNKETELDSVLENESDTSYAGY